MSKEVSATSAALPANVANMAQALAQSAGSAGTSGAGELFMKFTKTGEWVYGAEETEAQDGSVWAVNPLGLQHGWTCWGNENSPNKGKNLGEVMVPAQQPLPEEPAAMTDGTWTKAVAIQMRCTNGDDEGLQVLFKSNSRGGRQAYAALVQALVAQLGDSPQSPVALVSLEADSYKHNTYGKIMTPMITVTGWAGMDGEEAAEVEAVEDDGDNTPPEDPEPAKPARRRRRKAA